MEKITCSGLQHLHSLSGSIRGMTFKKNDMDGFCV